MTNSAARLDLRLNPTDKARIARAADLRGVPLSAFVRDAVLREAESVMAAELTVTLSAAESRRFLKALDAPFKPNARLKKAMDDLKLPTTLVMEERPSFERPSTPLRETGRAMCGRGSAPRSRCWRSASTSAGRSPAASLPVGFPGRTCTSSR